MRKSFLVFILLPMLTGKCFSQGLVSQIFHLDSIPAKTGVTLNKGWKFRAGDDPQWAKPGYDDATWQTVDPTLDLHKVPIVKKAGIGWFKLKINVDSSLFNERIAMVFASQGASEIYLDGELAYRFGTVSSDYKVEQTMIVAFRPLSLKLGNKPIQELAVRYSFNKKNLYTAIGPVPCMLVVLKENNKAFADYLRQEGFYQNLRSIQLSFYLPLGFLLLFLFFFLSTPKRISVYRNFFFLHVCGDVDGTLRLYGKENRKRSKFLFFITTALISFRTGFFSQRHLYPV